MASYDLDKYSSKIGRKVINRAQDNILTLNKILVKFSRVDLAKNVHKKILTLWDVFLIISSHR